MHGGDAHKHLLKELHSGAYDRLIAQDILGFLRGAQEVEGDLAKIQQLVKCVYFMNGQPTNTAEFYKRMVDNLDVWPAAQQQVIIDARTLLRERLENRLRRVVTALRTDDFIIDDPEDAFEVSFERLADALLRRTQITPQNKFEVMNLRSVISARRGRTASKRAARRAARKDNDSGDAQQAPAAPETSPREPSKIVACNLNDYSIEDVSSMVDGFVEGASQGDTTIREDVDRMLCFMARRDLPPVHRRGVKIINGAKVKFGTEDNPDKLWDFYEFKPTEAAGLSLRTNVAKKARIYFIKIDTDTIGVIGIQPRAKQDEFLRAIRIKIKRRGEG